MLFLFTDYVEDPVERYNLAYIYLVIIGVNVVINLVILIVIILRSLYRAIRNWYIRR